MGLTLRNARIRAYTRQVKSLRSSKLRDTCSSLKRNVALCNSEVHKAVTYFIRYINLEPHDSFPIMKRVPHLNTASEEVMKKILALVAVVTLVALFTTGCGNTSAGGQNELIISPSSAHIDAGSSKTFSASSPNDSAFQGVKWTLSGAGTLTNATAYDVTFVASSTAGTAQLTATSISNSAFVATVSVTTDADPKISSATMPTAWIGTAYNSSVVATGGVAPLTFAVTSGSLPPGLSLNGSSGAITGIPTTVGSYTFTVTVTDSNVPPMTFAWPITINVANPLAITKVILPAANVGTAYSFQPSATGGTTPYTWSISAGSLPPGLTLNSTTGQISGIPSANGTSSFTLQVSDSSTPAQTATLSTSVTVGGQSSQLSIPAQTLLDATVGVAYSGALQASGGKTPYTWTVTSGSLPAGLNLNASTGAITGTATAAATSNFTVTVTDSSSPVQSATASLSLRADAAFSISISALPAAFKSVPYTATLTATGAVGATTWEVTNGSLPAGLSLNASTGVISGTPSAVGTSSFTLQCMDSATPPRTATQVVNLVVNLQLSLGSPALPNGTIGVAYNSTPAATGGTAPITWSITAGALPPGLSLNAATGAIAGTPTTAGTYNFTLQLKDSSSPAQTASAQATIIINSPLSVTIPVLPNAILNVLYSTTLKTTGAVGPLTWSISAGSLPTGLTLNATTGVITGTPTVTGLATFTVKVADSAVPPRSATAQTTILVVGALSISGGTLPNAVSGTAYSATPIVTGGTPPLTWSVSAGILPPGLSLNPTTGAISGTPTTPGVYAFTLHVTDSSTPLQSANINATITVNAALALTVPTLPDAISGVPYVDTLIATGGTLPYTWSITSGALPAGLTLNPTTGLIAGTTTATGTSNFAVTLTDSAQPAQTKSFNLSIRVDSALTIGPITLPIGIVGLPLSTTISASGGVGPLTYSVSAGVLPNGLSLNAATGVISGTPLSVGTGAFTIQVKDSSNPPQIKTTASLSLVIDAALSINTTTLPSAISGVLYNTTLSASGGVGPITWSVTAGALPTGLTLNASTGLISGSSTALGLASFTVQAKDSNTPADVKTLAVTILVTPVLTISTSTLPNPILSVLYSTTLTATGGTGPITWSVSAGALPTGLTLNATTGVISGIPGLAGLTNFSVTATDSSTPAQTKTVALSLQINTALTFPVTSLLNAVLGNLYNTTLTASGGVAPITYSVTAGNLPLGLSLSTGGVISGTPTALGTASFTVTAKDSSNPPQTKSVALSILTNPLLSIVSSTLPNGVIGALYNTTLTTTGGVAPIKWAVTGGTMPTGLSLGATTGIISGTPTALASGAVIVQATDSSNPPQVQNVSLNLSVFAKLGITPITLAPGLLNLSLDASLAATGGNAPYTWSVVSGTLPLGVTLDATTGVLSGTPTVLGLFNFTVQVTDSAVPAQTATLALGLNVDSPGVNNNLLNGDYAFMFQGSNEAGPVAIVGSLQTDGTGNVTSGVLDVSQSSGVTQNVALTSGNLTINSDNRGTLTFTTPTLGTQNFRVAVDAAGALVRVIEADVAGTGTIRGNGVIKKQDPSAFSDSNISSALAFELEGNTLAGGRSAVIGSLVTDGGGKITSGLLDANSAGTVHSSVAVANTSTYSITGATTGRGTIVLNAGALGTVNGVIYVVNSTDIFFLRTDVLASGVDMLSGEILGQSGAFGVLPAGTGVLHVAGNSSTNASTSVGAGVVVSTGLGILTGTYDSNDGGTVSSNLGVTLGGNTVSNATAGRGTLTFAGQNLTMYFITDNEAFVMDASGTEVKTGMLEPQIGFPLTLLNLQTINYITGSQGVINPGATFQSGVETVSPINSLTGTVAATLDTNAVGAVINVGDLLSLNLTLAANGRISAGNTIYYLVGTNRIVAVEVGAGNLQARVLVADK